MNGQGPMHDDRTRSLAFERFAGIAAIGVGIGGLVYAILFAFIVAGTSQWVIEVWFLTLLLGGFLSTGVMVAVFERLRRGDPGPALWALLLGVVGAVGGIVHGAFSLTNLLNPPPGGAPSGPTPADPHGILRYAAAGLSLLIVGWIIHRGASLPKSLGYVAYLGGALLVFIYVGRLYDFITPSNRVSLVPPFVYGLVVHPVWYVWLGMTMRRESQRLRT